MSTKVWTIFPTFCRMFLKIFLSLVVEKSLKDVIFREIISMKNVTITLTKYELVKMFTIIILTLWYLKNDEHILPTKFRKARRK